MYQVFTSMADDTLCFLSPIGAQLSDYLIIGDMIFSRECKRSPWHLQRIVQRNALTREQIKSGKAAFDMSTIPQRIVNVYVLDSGIRTTHKEFDDNRAILGPNIRNPGQSSTDCNGHGTHVAALAVGVQSGVATKARAISVKVLDCEGKGSCADILSGMEWVANDSLRRRRRGERAVLIMSVGSTSDACSSTVEAARKLWKAGVFIAAAAGNRKSDACKLFPAQSEHTMAVAAVDDEDRLYAKNNMGACVDIFAPGVDIMSAGALDSDSKMEMKSGTSMATPLVGGAAALILGSRWTLSADQVKEVLISSSTKNKVLTKNGKVMTGTKNRLLYAPWRRLFTDIKMNFEKRDNSTSSKVRSSAKVSEDRNSSSSLLSVSLTLTPGVSPAMTYSATQIKRSLSRETGVKEEQIVVRRAEGAKLKSNESEPKQVPLVFYVPTHRKWADLYAAHIRHTIGSGKLRASSLENVTATAGDEAVRQNVTLPQAANEFGDELDVRDSETKARFDLGWYGNVMFCLLVIIFFMFLAFGAYFWAVLRSRNAREQAEESELESVV